MSSKIVIIGVGCTSSMRARPAAHPDRKNSSGTATQAFTLTVTRALAIKSWSRVPGQ
jgi:hypothetical protein